MTEYHLLTVEESAPDAVLDFKRSLVTGPLANSIRERFGATDPVYFHERQIESGHCNTCYSIDDVLTIECGEHRATFSRGNELPLNELLAWLDAPRRQAEEAAAREAIQVAANRKFNAQITGLVGVLDAVQAEGHTNDVDWFNALTARLKGEVSHDD